jgi:hypothetical protein
MFPFQKRRWLSLIRIFGAGYMIAKGYATFPVRIPLSGNSTGPAISRLSGDHSNYSVWPA